MPRLEDPDVAQRTRVVALRGFLSSDEIDELHAAAADVRARVGEVFRSNGCEPQSWSTTFLNHMLPDVLPDFNAKLHRAFREVDAANWKLLDGERRELSLRCAEYHTVQRGGGLPIEKHMDHGSLITLDIMLSPSSEYTGGVFQTLEADGSMAQYDFEQGDALLFQSHKFHCVSPLTSGTRSVFVCELWEGLPRICPQRCSDPWLPCYCKFAPVALYHRHQGGSYTPL